jgi:hypothetical protein
MHEILYKMEYFYYLIKKKYFSGFDFRKPILDIFKMSIFHLSKIEPAKNLAKKALVTEMLSFPKIGKKCCQHNFFVF